MKKRLYIYKHFGKQSFMDLLCLKSKYSFQIILCTAFWLAITIQAGAQKKRHVGAKEKNLKVVKQFVEVSNTCKQLPLYLHARVVSTNNGTQTNEVSTDAEGQFYLTKNASYVRFGEVEQMVNDSTALIVSDKMHKMMLYQNAGFIIEGMRNMVVMPLPDSSVLMLASKYHGSSVITKDTGLITLASHATLTGSSSPTELIELKYNAETREPYSLKTTRSSLKPINEEQYQSLKDDPNKGEKLVQMDGKGYFLIYEQSVLILYNKISHENILLPAKISDRVDKNSEGKYAPVKGYEHFQLIQN